MFNNGGSPSIGNWNTSKDGTTMSYIFVLVGITKTGVFNQQLVIGIHLKLLIID
jgi:hypothetical protein